MFKTREDCVGSAGAVNTVCTLQDWLFLAYQRVRGVEYGLLVATFIAIMVMGLELGIAAGIVAASLIFAYNYSKVRILCLVLQDICNACSVGEHTATAFACNSKQLRGSISVMQQLGVGSDPGIGPVLAESSTPCNILCSSTCAASLSGGGMPVTSTEQHQPGHTDAMIAYRGK